MSTLTIQLDDDAARLVREAAQMADQPLGFWLREKVCQAAARTEHTRCGVGPEQLLPLERILKSVTDADHACVLFLTPKFVRTATDEALHESNVEGHLTPFPPF